jgi:hypothetical protein
MLLLAMVNAKELLEIHLYRGKDLPFRVTSYKESHRIAPSILVDDGDRRAGSSRRRGSARPAVKFGLQKPAERPVAEGTLEIA